MTFVLIIGGLVLLFAGGEALLRGAVAFGEHCGLSRLVTGIVIVGLGTSMPEMFVAVEATYLGRPGIAVGNVIGSNIANILLILAVAGLIAPIARPGRILVPDGLVLMVVTVAIVVLGLQGLIPAWQGVMLMVILIVYLCWEVIQARRITNRQLAAADQDGAETEKPLRMAMAVVLTLVGLIMLPFGAHLLIEGATQAAKYFGVSDGLIGLTIVAIGTSLPELASVVMASTRGQSEIAYGNVVGSNLFNSLGVLGGAAVAGPLVFPARMVWFDGTIMIAATLLMIAMMSMGSHFTRKRAGLMLIAYAGYIAVRAQAG